MTFITTDQYNRRDANYLTNNNNSNNNLMAKKRKMYLYKRNALQEVKDDAIALGNRARVSSMVIETATTSQQQLLQTSTPLLNTKTPPMTSTPTSSYYSNNTNNNCNNSDNTAVSCFRVSVNNKNSKVLQSPQQEQQLQQQSLSHHCHHCHTIGGQDDDELYHPKPLRISVKNSLPPTLNCNTSNRQHVPTAASAAAVATTTITENHHRYHHHHHHRSCSCRCSTRLAGTIKTPETFGKHELWSPSRNSYYILSDVTNDANIGNNKGSNEAQTEYQQHYQQNSRMLYRSCFLTNYNNSTPSRNWCCFCRRFHNTTSASSVTEQTKMCAAADAATSDSRIQANAEPTPQFACSSSPTLCPLSSSMNQTANFYESPPPPFTCRQPQRRFRNFPQILQLFCMIFKILFTLMSTLLETNVNSSSSRSSQGSIISHVHHTNNPRIEKQRKINCHQRRRRRIHLLSSVSDWNRIVMTLSLLCLFFLSSSEATTLTMETSLENSIKSFSRSTESSLSVEPPRTEVRLGRRETVCKSLDIRNSPSEMKQLANCTVIEGFLLINLINCGSFEDYTETFPLLTEVTDFIIVYQVYYLRSLGQIFPNLRIIRGRTNFEGYGLLVYLNSHLEELALPKLTMIGSGVRIDRNVMLCFVKTIDWTQIVRSNSSEIYVDNNRDPIECPSCPGDQWDVSSISPNDLNCKPHHGRRNCWNSKHCQTICPERCRHNCLNEHTCCNEKCLGGCSPNDVNECLVCSKYAMNDTCVDKCPEGLLYFMDRRCLPQEECLRLGSVFEDNSPNTLVSFNGNCTMKCPENHYKVNRTCLPCIGECIKRCPGGLIDGAARAKEFTGCHIIEGDLTIIIKRASQIRNELEKGLEKIRVIRDFLKIQGTFGLSDLRFLKNLKTIQGKRVFDGKYALYVLENTDLEKIWNENQTVQIENGTVYFHFNPKLCLDEIHALLPSLRNQTQFNNTEVAEDSNGSKGSCNTTELNVIISKVLATVARVNITNPITYPDERTFIGYQFLHMEDPYGNATKYGYRPCDDSWLISDPSKADYHFFTGLSPYTRYAFYVKTMTISTERHNAQSQIIHFTTKSAQPSKVNYLHAYANSSSQIVMKWQPPTSPNGKLIKYRIRATYEGRVNHVESRNYCKDPLKVASIKIDKSIPTATTSENAKPPPPDCKCPKQKGGSVFPDESVDANIHANIEFENALQNFIYVKKKKDSSNSSIDPLTKTDANRTRRAAEMGEPSDSFLLRHMRDVSGNKLNDSSLVGHNTTTGMDITGTYYINFNASVNASTYEFTFERLKHFSWYLLDIEACREPEENNTSPNCSDQVKMYMRTLKLNDVDKVKSLWARTETTNSSRTNIRLFWSKPDNPNGAVVSYTIFYVLKTRDEFEEKKCVTEVDYITFDYENNGYVLSDLQSGNYSIRIKTNSLAGEGMDSETIYVHIPPNTLAPSIIAGIAVGVIVLIGLIGAIIYLLFRKRILTSPSDLKMNPAMSPHYISLQYIPDDWEVARENVIQLSPLGQGSFGMVYEGILKSCEDDTPCAIKTVNENATDRERINFLNEACVMKQFDTYHVVHLLGVCSRGQPALVIMELMKNGDLKSYLRAHRPGERETMSNGGLPSQPPPLSRIYQMAIEIADGMAYLSAKKFVHRDLAARNCMVAADLTVKIGDFGMTRDIYENDYYRKGTKGLLPVRWMAPESLRDGVYSTSSDVFSYGVVLWEMATLASQPYQGLGNDQVLRYVIDGGVMERPENCPDKLYTLMQKCWQHRPTARPSFIEIIKFLYDSADPNFREVSFYNSEEGQHILAKEIADRNQRSGDVFEDPENDMEDVTTPLRSEEYGNYKLDTNSSIGQRGDSSMIMDDDVGHSPYSIGSPMVVSSTPDEQSRSSVPRILHPNSHLLNSAPSTSAGLRKLGSSTTSQQLMHPHTHPHHKDLYQPNFYRQQLRQHHAGEIDAYVQPDFEPVDEGNKRDSDEQGYEIYDPSPNYREHVPVGGDDDEDDFGIHSTAVQNLIVRPKKQPTIMPLSTSMPDDTIAQQAASSLHPSTASAASSNASSSKAGTGKYPSLRAVADSARSRVMNMRLFHKRTGSNASHKSTNSNPNSSTGVGGSISNLARTGRGKSMSGQNLGTIESGGSGSASGSYGANPRFFSTSSGTSTSDNPTYRRLDDSVGDNSIIGTESSSTHRIRPRLHSASAFMMGSSHPTYKMLDESVNTTGSTNTCGENPNYEIMQPGGAPPPSHAQPMLGPGGEETTSSYVMMNEPSQNKKMPPPPPPAPAPAPTEISAMSISDEANYQLMSPLIPTNTNTVTMPTATPTTASTMPQPYAAAAATTVLAQPTTPATAQQSAGQANPATAASILLRARGGGSEQRANTLSSNSSTASTSSSHEGDDDDTHSTTNIKLQNISLRRRSSNDLATKKDRSRSQSSSSGKSATNTASSSIIPTQTSASQRQQQQQQTSKTTPSSAFSRKEQWFKEQQQTTTPQPPPNGFVGREA
ncbi:insulin-like receptor [Stomoxys calcitrans]|uniref:insulin-like receptor n=1 Tax=Stomoxys calcitrans TaxID=35570 RepID=UPI0027E24137|nr:insulin-like receptor [Stomoxys calcitrans]XP_013104156.2 insulin-like receptor [Stomoxys calcitrans]XP_059218981.1 insulin-like receptor [Stomoxys calcitrans]XP_059218982.1 insulin-like receptor [Stomoxys calcitrans]XP_059218983.1 insulin-like receptor [Stomoxys calcitrans]XP_059218985.1 insulin-like receptor [Stomoxys calcitrans]XP_059218986.1 insulin-like receptor [Stomoxys calcitrans]